MSDLISRQDAIDAFDERPIAWTQSEYETGLQNQYDSDLEAIQNVPSAQQWIPCSERLPEKNMWVMVTCFGLVTTAYLGTKDDGTEVWRNWCGQKQFGITAWMPLPAPWKGGTDGLDRCQ